MSSVLQHRVCKHPNLAEGQEESVAAAGVNQPQGWRIWHRGEAEAALLHPLFRHWKIPLGLSADMDGNAVTDGELTPFVHSENAELFRKWEIWLFHSLDGGVQGT